MSIATELSSLRPASDASQGRFQGDALLECDWCGRPVRRETALERVQQGGDGSEVVLLCSECELGTD
jgi:hypothetical protein